MAPPALTMWALLLVGAGFAFEHQPVRFAESPQQAAQPVFKGRIDLVRTDVSVLDNRTGKPITGLTERDFAISENGARQSIATFLAEGAAIGAAPTASDRRRIFLILFGAGRLDGPVDAFDGVLQFLRERARPTDLVSVMALNRATAFTADHEQVAEIVARMKHQLSEVKLLVAQEAARSMFQNLDISPATQASIDALFRVPDTLDGLRNLTTLLLGSRELRMNPGWRAWNREIAGRDLLKVYAGIEYLRGQEGEKHLICVTVAGLSPPPVRFINDLVGLRLDSGDGDRPLIVRANDASVALDIIHTSGTDRSLSEVTMTSQNVSGHTGGQFTSLRTAEAQLARIDDATRNGYVLGYVPKNPALDGKYRNVTVTVNRRDVTVIYRRGYSATADPPPIDVRDIITRQRLRDAATTDIAQDDIRVQGSASAAGGATREIRVELTIDPSRLTLTTVGDRREGTIDLMIVAGDAKRDVIGVLSQQMTLGMDEAHYRQALASGVPYVATVPVTGAVAYVKVLVYDFPSDRLGVTNINVTTRRAALRLASQHATRTAVNILRGGSADILSACRPRPAPRRTKSAPITLQSVRSIAIRRHLHARATG